MKCQILFSRKIKKNIISLSSAEFAHSMERVKAPFKFAADEIFCLLSWKK